MVRDGRLPDRRHQRLRRRPHQDAVTSLAWYAELGRRHELLSGLVPQISIILGKCAGGAVYSPIQTDLVVAVRDQGYMFVTGPDVIKDVTGEDVSLDELGAPTTRRATATSIRWWSPRPPHTSTCGTFCRFCRPTASTNRRSSTPGWNPKSPATIWNSTRSCRTPDNMAYDMHEVLLRIFDDGDFLDVAAQAGQAIITGYARVDGRTVGVVANQPMHMSGAIDNEASDKAARFIRFSDAFDIPLVFVVDTPGFLPGVEQERTGSSSAVGGSCTRWSRLMCRR